MALDIKDGLGAAETLKTTLDGADHVPHHHVDSSALPTGASTAANQTTANGLLTTIDADTGSISTTITSLNGKVTACNTGAVVLSSGTVTTVSTVTNLSQLGGAAIAMGTGVRSAGTQRVTIATDDVVPVTGTFWQATQPVSLASVPSHAVTNAGTFAVQVDGAALTSLQLLDDAVSGTGFNISQMNGVAVTMGNGASGTGVQRVTIANDSTGILAGVTTVSTVTTCSTLTGGGVAHDSADSGNPVKVGAIATASMLGRTPVAAADRSDLVVDTGGALIIRDGVSLEDIISEVKTNTDGASTAMTSAFAATASQRIYLTDLILANSSATAITVDIRDGSAGSVLATFPVPAGGGVVHSFRTPLRFSSNTAAAFDGSAAAATLSVTMVGFKAKF